MTVADNIKSTRPEISSSDVSERKRGDADIIFTVNMYWTLAFEISMYLPLSLEINKLMNKQTTECKQNPKDG